MKKIKIGVGIIFSAFLMLMLFGFASAATLTDCTVSSNEGAYCRTATFTGLCKSGVCSQSGPMTLVSGNVADTNGVVSGMKVRVICVHNYALILKSAYTNSAGNYYTMFGSTQCNIFDEVTAFVSYNDNVVCSNSTVLYDKSCRVNTAKLNFNLV